MNKSIPIIIAVAIVGGISAYAVSPYFLESTIDEALPTNAVLQPKDETMMDETMMDETMMDETMMDETMMDETVPMSYAGTFIGVGDGIHDAQGDAYTIPLEDKSNILRLENFESTNGPDLYVYLSIDDNASDIVNLGKLKANKGNQNYDIPEGTDLQKYNKVLIWCKSFSVLFGSAELSSR
ncbi:MAG: DM13 domain-containing protein [Nitrosopumilus sp.]|uniref:DM13 domain-containing protein n=1 Tax=Nitrosopumilus sp. TaxID=2024843 RepID=UPI00242B145C|nr:DM13 domain-containing protein [Nitrosopumilus sp.]MCV0366197.1 DM13 domain-containing protein [Nitrosopumilus sp.]